jgi:SAM-dependent methyltransferase
MDLESIKQHWQEWAKAGVDVRATTKTPTIKALEIDALTRAIAAVGNSMNERLRLLEAGCGNGQNCVALAQEFPNSQFDGFDYIEKMVESARLLAEQKGVSDRARFTVGDLTNPMRGELTSPYDVVFTVRAIINLNTPELQFQAIGELGSLVRPGGVLMLLENFVETYERQNDCREMLGLPRRSPASFNRFLDGGQLESFLSNAGFEIVTIDDFGSLHDLMLYVLLPSLNKGQIDYENPLIEAVTKLCKKMFENKSNLFGQFGQNRLFVFRKTIR